MILRTFGGSVRKKRRKLNKTIIIFGTCKCIGHLSINLRLSVSLERVKYWASVYLSIYICLSLERVKVLGVCLSIYVSICLSLERVKVLSVSIYLSIYLSIFGTCKILRICLSIYLSVYMSLSIYPSI